MTDAKAGESLAGGMMGALMRSLDWSSTPVGPVDGWPQSLKTAVRIALHSRYPMFVWWGPQRINFYNDGYIPVLGKRHPMALGRPAADVWSDIWETVGPQADLVYEQGRATWNEQLLLVMERNGYPEETYFTFSYSPIVAEDGRVEGLFCACSEETERVLNERRLRTLRVLAERAAEARSADEACDLSAQALVTNPHDVPFALLYLLDESGERAHLSCEVGLERGSEASPETIEIGAPTAWPLDEVLATGSSVLTERLFDRFPPLPGGPWPEAPETALVLPVAHPGHERPAGFLVAGVSPRRAFDDGYRGFFDLVAGHIATAIANARAHEAERRRAEALAEIDRAKTDFFSNVSHEFRTPLALMLGPLEDALSGAHGELSAAQREDLLVAHRNGLRMLKLVNTLLDFSRIEAGRIDSTFEPVDLAAATAEIASAFRSAAERAGLRFVVDCAPLPEPIYVDREMWEKIVLNLVSNALKFTFEGEIAVSLEWTGEAARLTVRDTGTGIAPSELPQIFERFYRNRGARSRTHEGTGIGLALVQELVHLHGGEIVAESVEGEGSMFTVTVPAGRSHLPDDRIGAPRARMSTSVGAEPFVAEAMRWLPGDTGQLEADSGPGAVDEATIVLADDNADMREYLTRLLGGRWRVVAAADGNAALEAVRARRPDLVLTDVMMPGLDGFALLEAIREDPRTSSIPVILLSGRAGEEARVEGLQAGADDYLVKPFGARELIARVGAHLALARVRRDAAAAMRESEDRLRMAVESAGLGTWDFRPSTGKLTWDDRCKAMFGLPPDADVDYDTFVAGLHPDDRERVHEVVRRALTPESGGRVDDEYRTVGIADGVERWVAVKGQAYFDAEGRAVRYVGTVRDITAEKRAEKERETLLALEREARRQAEEASRLKDEFLATVSHELRTPLNAILGWSLLLYERRVEGEATSRALETIDRNARALAQLVEDLLDVSRIISGKLRLDVEIIEPAPCIEAAIETLEPAAAAKGISVATALDHHAGPVSGDPARLQQIVWNLLSNAIKFTPRGGHVEVKLSRVASHVEITVEDSGQGISPEFLPHVFDRFRQADGATTRSHGGLGLGLAIARHLVEAHGGSIEAASEGKGRGAAFTLSLPLAAVRPDSRPFAAVEPDEERRLDGVRVLVVDDDADARALVAVVVKQRGAEVASAGSAAEALALVETFRPDVLVSDIGMPGRDGYDLIRAVRALPPERGGRTPAVALTAYARVEDRVRAIRAGYQLHVPKPVEPEELAVVVASLATNDLR